MAYGNIVPLQQVCACCERYSEKLTMYQTEWMCEECEYFLTSGMLGPLLGRIV